MAVFWILFFTLFQIFGELLSNPVEPLCGNLRLQYVFFLVPPSSELPELTKFLTNIKSAMFLETSRDYGMVQVTCDPEDWLEIYRYTKDQDIYLLHSAYCMENSEFSALEKLRLHEDKLKKIGTNKSPGALIGREKSEGVREKYFLKESNTGVLRVLKNGRMLKTGEIHSQLSANENSSRKVRSENRGKKETPSSKTVVRKSQKNPREKIPRRSIIDTEAEGSLIEKFFHRLKRYSWDLLTKNFHSANDNHEITNRMAVQSRSTPSGKTIETKGTSSPSREPCNTKSNAMVSEKDVAATRTKTTNDVMAPNAPSAISELEKNKLTGVSGAERTPSRTENTVKVYFKENEELEVGKRGNLKLERSRRGSKRGTTEKVLEDSTRSEEDEEDEKHTHNDGSKYDDHDCLATKVDTLDELAEYVHSIFNWVKKLETRGKKG